MPCGGMELFVPTRYGETCRRGRPPAGRAAAGIDGGYDDCYQRQTPRQKT